MTGDDWNLEEELLCSRILQAKTIAGTPKLHSFIPIDTSTLELRTYSETEESRFVTIAQQGIVKKLELGAIRGYVAVEYDGMWWLAHVNQVDAERKEVLAKFYIHMPPVLHMSIHSNRICFWLIPVIFLSPYIQRL